MEKHPTLSSLELAKAVMQYPKRERPAHPAEFTQHISKISEMPLRIDAELADLMAETSVHFDDRGLVRFLQSYRRFDGPITIKEYESGELKKIEHLRLRRILKELPRCVEAAKVVGLTYEQMIDVLVYVLESEKYSHSHIETKISDVTRAFLAARRYAVELGQHLDAFKSIIKFGQKEGVLQASLRAFSLSLRLGLSVEQAYKIINIAEANSAIVGYLFPHFNNALKSMLPAKVRPELVVELFDFFAKHKTPSVLYDYFKNLMTFAAPKYGIAPNELIALFLNRVRQGKKDVPLLTAGEGQERSEPFVGVPKEKYFIENKNETLEHAALPYRMIKPLNEGIRDLETMALARYDQWEEVGEGFFAFDVATKTWYSFGGETEALSSSSVKHHFLPYDISNLSQKPHLFHVHPQASEVPPAEEDLSYPELRDVIAKFTTVTPSGADYGVVGELLKKSKKQVPTRSFITHALGVTEFTYPDDVAKLEEMQAQSRDIRDQAVLNFDVEEYLLKHGFPVDTLHMVQSIIEFLNKKLPPGFSLKLYPTGTDFSKIV